MTALWQSGLLSNFHYLDFLNCAAGRSRNDFSQYPVFPWVLADYSSPQLNLEDARSYRDLTKPVGALSEKRLSYFRERMAGMDGEDKFLYGTHYSTPAYVIYWLLRAMPERHLVAGMLRLHNGHFDAPWLSMWADMPL
ncbi:lvsF [Symbiodinium sp. KB8]|nr:lvsF [Symbiodinium sp. KB8]